MADKRKNDSREFSKRVSYRLLITVLRGTWNEEETTLGTETLPDRPNIRLCHRAPFST